MAFLTKKEQSLITAINVNTALTQAQRGQMVQQIKDNASLRQHGWRMPVREFIQAMAVHQRDKMLLKIK